MTLRINRSLHAVILGFGTPGERASGSFSVENGRQLRGSEAESEGFRFERSPRRSDNCALLKWTLGTVPSVHVATVSDLILISIHYNQLSFFRNDTASLSFAGNASEPNWCFILLRKSSVAGESIWYFFQANRSRFTIGG